MSEVMAKPNIKEEFLANFYGQEIADTYPWQKEIRDQAQAALNNLEFPTRRDEYWKYTRVNSILKQEYTQVPNFEVNDISPYLIKGLEAHILVFINGHFSEKLSDFEPESGITFMPIAKARTQHPEIIQEYYGKYADHKTQPFTALNTVFNTNGTFVYLPKNTSLSKPIHVLNLSTESTPAFNPRNLIVLGQSSEATILNTHETINGAAFTNSISEIIVGENAKLDHYLLQNESENSSQINTTNVHQSANSIYSAYTFTFNSGWVRNNLNIDVDAENCETNMYGLYLLKGNQHVDNHTYVNHLKPNCNSNELYKGIVAGKATGVFNGKVFVRPNAQKTNAFQSNQNILLTDNASVYSKPELEIYADDVKCSHGSTTGQMDDEALFYLRARGIKRSSAEMIMLQAFMADVLEEIKLEPVKVWVESLISDYHTSINQTS